MDKERTCQCGNNCCKWYTHGCWCWFWGGVEIYKPSSTLGSTILFNISIPVCEILRFSGRNLLINAFTMLAPGFANLTFKCPFTGDIFFAAGGLLKIVETKHCSKYDIKCTLFQSDIQNFNNNNLQIKFSCYCPFLIIIE